MEFYNPNRPEQWSNCQYIPTKFNNGQQVDIYGRSLPLDTIERVKTLLKDPNGNEKVDLQDMVWTGNKKTFFDDHVMLSRRIGGNTVIDYKTPDDKTCLKTIREMMSHIGETVKSGFSRETSIPPKNQDNIFILTT